MKSVFPKEVLVTLYKTLIASYIHYGSLVWGMDCNIIESLQKRAVRLITNNSYIAHKTPLFKEEKILKVQDIFKLRLLKFYYKLCSGLLPPYFNRYREIIEREPLRVLRQHVIDQPMLKRVYAECTPLFQLIKLLITMRNDPFDTILESIEQMNLSYCQLSYTISKTYLNIYDPICRIKNCFVCTNRYC